MKLNCRRSCEESNYGRNSNTSLHVHRFTALSLELVHKYWANFVVNLDLESDVYEWDGEKVVEVDHDND